MTTTRFIIETAALFALIAGAYGLGWRDGKAATLDNIEHWVGEAVDEIDAAETHASNDNEQDLAA